MLQLQPRLPRRKKKEEAPADRKREPEEGRPEPEHHERTREKEGGTGEGRRQETPSGKDSAFGPKSRMLVIGAVAAMAVIIILAVAWAFYPSAPPGPTNVVTDSQVLAEMDRLHGISPNDINPADYPKVFGIYGKNNLTLVEQYYCSDVCPDYGRVDLVFQGITNEQCQAVGGYSLHDLAWGGYIGCKPRAMT